uniref:Uncharacterized protein n=1 Tax=Setaria italica TaxID=4555 RepID=K3YNZ3_SETIT
MSFGKSLLPRAAADVSPITDVTTIKDPRVFVSCPEWISTITCSSAVRLLPLFSVHQIIIGSSEVATKPRFDSCAAL